MPAVISDYSLKFAQKNLRYFWGVYFKKIIPENKVHSYHQEREKDSILEQVRLADGNGKSFFNQKTTEEWSTYVAAGFTPKVMYGVPLQHGDLEGRIDQIIPHGDGSVNLGMIRSVLNPGPEHYLRLAFHKRLLENSGVRVRACHMWMLNPDYRPGSAKKLLFRQDVSGAMHVRGQELEQLLTTLRDVISHPQRAPKGAFCPEMDASDLPPDHVFKLNLGAKKAQLAFDRGVTRLADWPNDIPLSTTQEIQVRAHRTGKLQLNRPALEKFFSQLKYPVHFLDFETAASAIPLYPEAAPFEAIPFMFSNCVQHKPSASLEENTFIASPGKDPRRAFVSALTQATQGHGSIVVYNEAAEKTMVRALASKFPEEKPRLDAMENSMVDLYAVFRSFHFYHPEQSAQTLKELLNVFVGVKYAHLLIKNGQMAEQAWLDLHSERDPDRIASVIGGLKTYCHQDACGMAQVMEYVKSQVCSCSDESGEIRTSEKQIVTIPRDKRPGLASIQVKPTAPVRKPLDLSDVPAF